MVKINTIKIKCVCPCVLGDRKALERGTIRERVDVRRKGKKGRRDQKRPRKIMLEMRNNNKREGESQGVFGREERERKEKHRESVCAHEYVCTGTQGRAPGLSFSPTCSSLSLTNSWPVSRGHRMDGQHAEPSCLFKQPRATGKFNIVVKSSLFIQHH